jgi:hypothetical protein
VTREEQLRWEARWAVPAAIASFAAAVLFVVSATLFLPKDRKGIGGAADLLLSIDQRSGPYLASQISTTLAALLLIGVFVYLFRAILARGGGVPGWFVYLIYAAPILFAIGSVGVALHALDVSDTFTSSGVIRGDPGNERARDLLTPNALLVAAQTAGTVGVAFLFVMLPLRARRVGLLTPFMGVIGAIAGALIVFQLAGVSAIVQGFWLGALGVLLLGRWPGGRGPAWESGEPEPWLTQGQRRAAMDRGGEVPKARGGEAPMARGGQPSAPSGPPQPDDPETVPERPPSRKRRKKKRR